MISHASYLVGFLGGDDVTFWQHFAINIYSRVSTQRLFPSTVLNSGEGGVSALYVRIALASHTPGAGNTQCRTWPHRRPVKNYAPAAPLKKPEEASCAQKT